MRTINSVVAGVSLSLAFLCPALAQSPASSSASELGVVPQLPCASSEWLAKAPKAKSEEPQELTSPRAVADMRLAAVWFASAYHVPARVAEEMFLAGYTYRDVLIAFSLMDDGASLNELLDRRRLGRWEEIMASLNMPISALPKVIGEVLHEQQPNPVKGYIHFVPDVRVGLADRLRLPVFSPNLPDPVSVGRFRLSEDDVKNIRVGFDNINNLQPEMLRKSAGRSLCVADWIIAAVLAKYRPFPLDTLLSTRTGEVVEWSDVATIFSIDPEIFSVGPLAPIYAVLSGGDQSAVIPTFRRQEYPQALPVRYDLRTTSASEKTALAWLMSLNYQLDANEKTLLKKSGLSLGEADLAASLARLADVKLAVIVDKAVQGQSWQKMVEDYHLDLTGHEALVNACRVYDAPDAPLTSSVGR